MKTKIISLSAVVFLLFSFMFSHAQGLRFGVRLDPQLSWYAATGDIVSNTSNRLGLNGGLVIDNYFSDNYALATGLSLSSVKGGVSYNEYTELTLSGEERTIAPNSELFYKLQYLEVPLGLKMKTREFGYITFFAQLGFTGQINIKATVETELPDSKELDATDEINLL
ncbi:MAG: porin family protein, partial [Bacteroidota bacterium]